MTDEAALYRNLKLEEIKEYGEKTTLEDGTVLWKSEELLPGQVVRSITLNQPLSAGEYENAVLSYQHWTYDQEKKQLNGAETLVTLTVGQS